MNTKLSSFLQFLSVLAVTGAIVFLGIEYLNLQKQVTKNNAVQGCMEISSFTSNQTENGIVVVEPVVSAYTKCLSLKGIEVPQE